MYIDSRTLFPVISSFRGNYSFLSNFYIANCRIDDRVYPSSEHAYMSFKSDDIEWKNICTQRHISPGKIKRLSKSVDLPSNWETTGKIYAMQAAVFAKFTQNEDLKKRLMDTGDAFIVEENDWKDTFWGVCSKSRKGHNYLGGILMTLRENFRKEGN